MTYEQQRKAAFNRGGVSDNDEVKTKLYCNLEAIGAVYYQHDASDVPGRGNIIIEIDLDKLPDKADMATLGMRIKLG